MNPAAASFSNPQSGRFKLLDSFAWVALPLVCHVGFSWIGFNPTDEGWLQAIARRMLEGEIPHRDFISIRPVLSALLQVPVVWLGGDHMFWLARLWGWLEIGGIAWLWTGLLLGPTISSTSRILAYLAVFCLCAHVFPVMAWHTLDGLLLCSLAVTLTRADSDGGWRAAFVCVGLAALCRQNFALFTPFLALGLNWRRWHLALWAALPIALYLLVLAGFGALSDFFRQILASQGLLLQTAVLKYVHTPAFLLGALAGALLGWGLGHMPRRTKAGSMLLAWAAAGGYAAYSLAQGAGSSIRASFILAGLSGGLVLVALASRPLAPTIRFHLLASLGLAWVAAISLGYNSPALMGGVLLLVIGRVLAELTDPALLHGTATRNLLVVFALTLGAAHWHARQAYPYQERPADELRWNAGEVMRGASGLRTNALTYGLLQDLRELTDRYEAENRPYAILSDYSAHWAASRQRNPLPCEWPQATELSPDPVLIKRFVRDLCQLSPDGIVIVQKHLVSAIALGLLPVQYAQEYYAVQEWLRQNGRRVGETSFFELYVPPTWFDPVTPGQTPR